MQTQCVLTKLLPVVGAEGDTAGSVPPSTPGTKGLAAGDLQSSLNPLSKPTGLSSYSKFSDGKTKAMRWGELTTVSTSLLSKQ